MPIHKDVLCRSSILITGVISKIWLISNAFIWYFCTFFLIRNILTEIEPNYLVNTFIWLTNFSGAAVSAIVCSVTINSTKKRLHALTLWIFLGVFSSLLVLLYRESFIVNVVISFFIGISFGVGLPVCMGYYTDATPIEKRGRFAGLILFVSYTGAFVLFMIITNFDTVINAITLAIFRGSSFLSILPSLGKSSETTTSRKEIIFAYTEILRQKAFVYYFIPWLMFSLVNYLSLPVQLISLGENVGNTLVLIENILVGILAIVGGFLSDVFGRKRPTIIGFLLLGIGYGILGLSSENLLGWYIYTVIDGIAWGILEAVLLLTIWGDLSQGTLSEKYYALGGLPYLLSNFLRITFGPYIARNVPAYEIFSFVAFFLFLAIFPLTLAPETLPEKILRERELRSYIERAKRVREKFTRN